MHLQAHRHGCLGLALWVLNKLPTIPIKLSYCTPIPMMLAYGPESYTFQIWHEDGEETYSLGKKARISHLLTRKLKWLTCGSRIDDSSLDRSASSAHSNSSAMPGSMGCSPSGSHFQSRSTGWIWVNHHIQHLFTGDPERISHSLWLREQQWEWNCILGWWQVRKQGRWRLWWWGWVRRWWLTTQWFWRWGCRILQQGWGVWEWKVAAVLPSWRQWPRSSLHGCRLWCMEGKEDQQGSQAVGWMGQDDLWPHGPLQGSKTPWSSGHTTGLHG